MSQVEEVLEPDQALLARLMLQRDGCAGDVAFLIYSSVRSPVPLPPASCPMLELHCLYLTALLC